MDVGFPFAGKSWCLSFFGLYRLQTAPAVVVLSLFSAAQKVIGFYLALPHTRMPPPKRNVVLYTRYVLIVVAAFPHQHSLRLWCSRYNTQSLWSKLRECMHASKHRAMYLVKKRRAGTVNNRSYSASAALRDSSSRYDAMKYSVEVRWVGLWVGLLSWVRLGGWN